MDELVNSFGKYTLVKNGDKKYYVFTLTEDVCMIVSPGYGMATGSVDFIYMGYEKDGSNDNILEWPRENN